jgi:hypothetical protein
MMRRATLLLSTGIALTAPPAQAAPEPAPVTPCGIIHAVFRSEGRAVEDQACRVAGCESTGDATGHHHDRWATNGQYLGLFQLGAWARSRFLRGPWFGSWANARAAHRLYIWNGRSWYGQWSCAWAA